MTDEYQDSVEEPAAEDVREASQESSDIDIGRMSSEQINQIMEKMRNNEEVPELSGASSHADNLQEQHQEEQEPSPVEKEVNNYKQAMKEERRKRQELEQKQQELEKRLADILESQDDVIAKQESGEMEDDEAIDELEQLRREQKTLYEKVNSREQQELQQAQANKFISEYKNAATEFAQSTQDFPQAYEFLQNNRLKEYQAMGFSPEESQNILINDEYKLVSKSNQDNVNPAKRIYELAKARGYTGINQHTSNVKKGLEASRSLGQASSRPDNFGDVSIEDMANMTGGDFSKAWDQMRSEAKKKTFLD